MPINFKFARGMRTRGDRCQPVTHRPWTMVGRQIICCLAGGALMLGVATTADAAGRGGGGFHGGAGGGFHGGMGGGFRGGIGGGFRGGTGGRFRGGFGGGFRGSFYGGAFFDPFWDDDFWDYYYPYDYNPYDYYPYSYYNEPYGPNQDQGLWYCQDPRGYYPTVSSCNGRWQSVPMPPPPPE